MNLDEIKKHVAHIDTLKGDNEAAHCAEDALYAAFISYVAKAGTKELIAMAQEILKTGKIDFCRWCA